SGWATGECKEDPNLANADIFSDENLRAVSVGLQYRDMVALIAHLLEGAERTAKTSDLRTLVVENVKSAFSTGRGVFQGDLENWSFRPGSRAAARTPFIVMRESGSDRAQLAPVQYVSLRDDRLKSVKTLYLDIDMTRIFRVDDAEKSFFAEFYLSMHATEGLGIEQIEFANAFLDPKTNNRQLTIRPLHEG